MKKLIPILFFPVVAFSQQFSFSDIGFYKNDIVYDTGLNFTFLTNQSTTTDATYYQTEEFTSSSNVMLLSLIHI